VSCRDQQLERATLRNGSLLLIGRHCPDQGTPILRLREEVRYLGSEGAGRLQEDAGLNHQPSASNQPRRGIQFTNSRLKDLGGLILVVWSYITVGGLIIVGYWMSQGLCRESVDRRIPLVGKAQPIGGSELEVNSLLCRLNVMAGWVSVAEAMDFDEHIWGTSTRCVTLARPYEYRSLLVYHVQVFNASHPSCANHLVNATKIQAWRLATEDGRTAIETLVLHNI